MHLTTLFAALSRPGFQVIVTVLQAVVSSPVIFLSAASLRAAAITVAMLYRHGALTLRSLLTCVRACALGCAFLIYSQQEMGSHMEKTERILELGRAHGKFAGWVRVNRNAQDVGVHVVTFALA